MKLRDIRRSRRRATITAAIAASMIIASCAGPNQPTERPGADPPGHTAPRRPANQTSTNPMVLDEDLLAERANSSPLASTTAAYAGVEYADDLKAEQQENLPIIGPAPIGGYRIEDFASEFTTVVDGMRVTVAPTCSCPRATVWLVGGSAAFGLGQRDEHTIASALVGEAAGDGVALEVVNLALPGWTRWQELQGVLARLAGGAPAPDLVISYGGFNDVIGLVFQELASGTASNDIPTVWDTRYAGTVMDAIVADPSGGLSSGFGARAGRRATGVAAQMRYLLHAAGSDVLFVHQPDALASPGQSGDLIDWLAPALDPNALSDALAGFDEALEASAEATGAMADGLDLRSIYDGADRPFFPDIVHTNEAGAAIVAAAIWDRASILLPAR